MDFEYSPKVKALQQRLAAFMDAHVYPNEGRFQEEIVPIEVKLRDGSTKIFDTDEHPRRDSSMEKMASLRPLHPEIEDFPITAGNASGVNDGGAALMIVSSEYAQAHGLMPMARIISWASTGMNPADTGLGPIASIPKAPRFW